MGVVLDELEAVQAGTVVLYFEPSSPTEAPGQAVDSAAEFHAVSRALHAHAIDDSDDETNGIVVDDGFGI
jgi:hypothetical protein